MSFFKIDEYSRRIRDEFNQGGVFEELIQKYLLDNKHKIRLQLIPDEGTASREESQEAKKLQTLSSMLTSEEKDSIIQEAYALQQHQEKLQDQTILPTLSISDISRNVEFIDDETSYINGKVKVKWFDQPTNGISYVRIKANLKSLPEQHRIFVPMFKELLDKIGTKNYKYDVFNDKLLNSTNGLEVSIDKYAYSDDHNDIYNRNE